MERARAMESEPNSSAGLITVRRQFGLSYWAIFFSFITWDLMPILNGYINN